MNAADATIAAADAPVTTEQESTPLEGSGSRSRLIFVNRYFYPDSSATSQMLSDLASMYKIKVIFASVTPVSDAHMDLNPAYEQTQKRPPLYINALNDWIQQLCLQRSYTYLDYFSVLMDKKGLLQADLSDDGLHPNSKGYRLMAPVALAAIQKTVRPPAAVAPKPAVKPGTGKQAPGKPAGSGKASN